MRDRSTLASVDDACEEAAMAFIATVSPRNATGETAAVYRYMAEVGGVDLVANVVRLFSLRPASMRRMIRSWELTMWTGDEPRALRELVAAAVSRLNDCHY
jgi:alkylhydroperoxidase family enzyme